MKALDYSPSVPCLLVSPISHALPPTAQVLMASRPNIGGGGGGYRRDENGLACMWERAHVGTTWHCQSPTARDAPATEHPSGYKHKRTHVNSPPPSLLDDACGLVPRPALVFVVFPVCACRDRCMCGRLSFSQRAFVV